MISITIYEQKNVMINKKLHSSSDDGANSNTETLNRVLIDS